MKNIVLPVLILLSVVSSALANATGSPVCDADASTLENVGNKPMGSSADTLGFSFASSSLKYSTSDSSIDIEVKGTTAFYGILIYVYSGSSSTGNHVGNFTLPDSSKYKFVANCASSDSTVTHSSADSKGPNVTFKWKPPSSDLGNLKVKAVFVVNKSQGFQIVESTIASSSGGSNSTTGAPTATTGTGNDGTSTSTGDASTKTSDGSHLLVPRLFLSLILTLLVFINF